MRRILVGIRGDRACFTTGSISKQNRFSYPVITASAARGVLSSIFLKPEFDWMITRIAVMRMGHSDRLTVNEVRFLTNNRMVYADEHRIQVSMRILRYVDYVIEAEPVVLNPGPVDNPNTPAKYLAEFAKRMTGKKPFYATPYLGLRELVGRVYPVDTFPTQGQSLPDLTLRGFLGGWSHGDQRGDHRGSYPSFTEVEMVNGIIQVPPFIGATYKVGSKS